MKLSTPEIFGPGGLLSRHLAGYQPRGGQVTMAQIVEGALEGDEHAIIEAPTGIGKSLAYTFPAVTRAIAERPLRRTDPDASRRVLIVTGGITLQEQLAQKDLPFVQRLLPTRFSFTVLKGMNNYVCRERLRELETRGIALSGDLDALRDQLAELAAWAAETETGDRSELAFEPDAQVWRQLSVDSSDCLEEACPFYQAGCFAREAREQARHSTVVVVNYHLLFMHLLLLEATGEHVLLPPFDIVILDEAHEAADIARDLFGWRLSLTALQRMAAGLDKAGRPELREALVREGERFCAALARHRGSGAYKIRIRTAQCATSAPLIDLLVQAGADYESAMEALRTSDGPDEQVQSEDQRRKRTERAKDLVRFRQLAERCVKAAERIRAAMNLTAEEMVFFIDEDRRDRGVLCARQIDVSLRIREGLFDQARSVIVTSATLSNGGSFDLLRSELGVPEARERVVRSPFDLSRQARLIVPDELPEPTDPAWPGTVARLTREVTGLARGRTLGLFTSHRNLELAFQGVKGCGYPVLRQNDAPRMTLIQRFRDDASSVLLGTESFWTGVDVQGEACSCVIIDRLPFPRLDDPVMDALKERFPRDWFQRYYLPRAVIAFKQGFGRLIRSTADRGVVVVLDRRLLTKPYGRLFLIDLNGLPVSRDLDDVSRFLDRNQEETPR